MEIINKNAIRFCPICGNNKSEILHNQQFLIPSGIPLPDAYDVVCCATCHCVYADTPNTQQQYDEYYAFHSKYEHLSLSSEDDSRYTATTNYLAHYLTNDSKILDIGCSNGGLLKKIRDRDCLHVTGIDPSLSCIQHLAQQGIQGLACTLSDISSDSSRIGQHDFIILSHVMEHLVDPSAMMLAIKGLMNSKALVYIEVPDAANYRSHFKKPFHYFDVEHINHFDLDSLTNLAKQNGFRVIDSGRKILPVSDAVQFPAVYVVVQTDSESSSALIKCESLRHEMREYISLSLQAQDEGVISQLASSQAPIILWGVGSYAQNLLKISPLRFCNIVDVVDRDPKKQGASIQNKIIKDPATLLDSNHPNATILVASIPFATEIIKEIAAMGIDNRVIVA